MSVSKPAIAFIDVYGPAELETAVVEGAGYDLRLRRCTSDDEVVELADGAAAILTNAYPVTEALLQRLTGVQVIVRGGVGYDTIDVDAATRAGIAVCNVVDYGTAEVANHTMALLLALNRNLLGLDQAVRQGTRGAAATLMPNTQRLDGQVLGLLGFGAIARAVARRARGFGMDVLACDPYVAADTAGEQGVRLTSLDGLLQSSDVLSVHVPLTAENEHMIGAAQLERMKPTAFVLLTSRGGIVDEAALAAALGSGALAGAGIDVWETEPPARENPLLHLPNVVATMHMAWYSERADIERRTMHAQVAVDFLDGRTRRTVVNPTVLAPASGG